MALPPSFSNGLPNQLMSEEEIRQYFLKNGGVVKNTEIVNYFRTYLSNPAIKDEARIIFKTYVNKLANVKVENGEKFLVLKRQYFPPIDGNGSNANGLPPINSYTLSSHHTQSQPIYGHTGYLYNQLPNQRQSVSSTSSQYIPQMNPYPSGGGPPPYGYPPPVSSTHNNLRRQNSQSQIYGSHYSLNSNYADPYASQSQYNNYGMSQYYQQMSAGLGHGHGGSTFSLASQYTTASSAGVPPYNNSYHHQAQQQLHHQQQVPMQNNTHVQPQLQRSLSQTYAQQHHHYQPPVSQVHQFSQQQQHQQALMPKSNNSSGYTSANSGHGIDYPPEYGLPPLNPASSVHVGSPQNQQQLHRLHNTPPHRHISPQSSGGSGNNRAPPPYRPPPPAANNNFGSPTSPTGPPPVRLPNNHNHVRRSSLSSSSMSAGASAIRFNRSPSVPGGPISQYHGGSSQNINSAQYQDQYNGAISALPYQRSVSAVSSVAGVGQGIPSSVLSSSHHQQHFQSPDHQNRVANYADDTTQNPLNPGAPPPPVPPRHKRGVERSPSAVSSATSGSSSGNKSASGASANFGGNRISNRRNMDVINGNSSNVAGVGSTMNGNGRMGNDYEKENINLANVTNDNFDETETNNSTSINANGSVGDGPNDNNNGMQNGDSSEAEQKISVRERMQKFNRIASESEIAASKMSANKGKREISSKHESVDFDTASLSSYGYGYGFSHTQLEPRAKEWMLKSAQCDYHTLNKLAQENPSLVRRRDMNGYTALHWAAKKGHVELVKLLAGTFQCDVNAKSNGGYTPLHLAAQFSRQEVYDVLVKAYNADVNVRDHSGKKPMQYLVRQDTSVSMDTFKKIKEKRRSNEMHRDKDSSFLRIGSLNVKVKSTREAFGYLLGKSSSSSGMERIVHKNWGSADNIPEAEVQNGENDKQIMPPPPGVPSSSSRKKKTRRVNGNSPASIKENISDSDSDSAFGFGSNWQSP